MQASYSLVCRMRVYTSSGMYVGKVRDVVFDIDTCLVQEYVVKKSLYPAITIATSRVVRYDHDARRMIVNDQVTATTKQSFVPSGSE